MPLASLRLGSWVPPRWYGGEWGAGGHGLSLRRRWPVLGMQKPRLLGVSDGVQVETLVPQSEGYMMAGTDASTGNP